jgi:methylated-DNA-[protein]-cysteine S-methyltransferase
MHNPYPDRIRLSSPVSPLNVVLHDSPIGPLTLLSDGESLTGVHFAGFEPPSDARLVVDSVLETARHQLDEYFAAQRSAFDLPLAPAGTPFQRRVWAALLDIPFGETWSYAALARAIGKPSATRAVGAANGANPIAVVVPCHRVVGADGSLTGFGGGLDRKRFLISLEQRGTLWRAEAS